MSNLVRVGRSLATLAVGAVFILVVAGCQDQAGQIQSLQKEVNDLKAEKDHLGRQLHEKTNQTTQAEQDTASLNKLPADRWALIPKATTLEIEDKSGLRVGKPELFLSPTTQPTDGPVGVFARLYLAVTDGQFSMRAVGPMTISLFDLATNPPRTLGVYHFTPQEVAKHYTTVFMRELFGFDLPLSAAPKENRVTARVEFTDYLTGRTLVAEQALTLAK